MRQLGIFIFLFGLILSVGRSVHYGVYINNEYEEFISEWIIADRVSTLNAKQEHVSNFIIELENSNLRNTEANWLANNNTTQFETNLNALKSLNKRLLEIKDMPVNSTEYQFAINQITQQEINIKNDAVNNIKQCWMRKNHYTYSNNLINGILVGIMIISLFIGLMMFIIGNQTY